MTSREYNSFKSMRSRCSNKNNPAYKNYGGRGIKVCDRWLGVHGFSNFLEDMGPRPKGYSLDRIDVNGDYCPENCRWASDKQQCNNKRNNTVLCFGGETHTITEWSEIIGVKKSVISNRIKRGLSISECLAKGRKPLKRAALIGRYSKRTGVSYDNSRNKWTASITINGKSHQRRFDTEEDAIAYRKELECKKYGYTLDEL